MTNEETWRGWNLSLQCAHNKMALKAMEPGSALSFPLIQVPETCDYSTHHNELGLVLVVPYDGCNVMLENGRYVLSMRWLESPVKLVCPMSPTTPESTEQSRKFLFHRRPWKHLRSKRDTNHYDSVFDPSNLYYHYWYEYYMYVLNTLLTANTATTSEPDSEKVPFYPNYIYYPYYSYFPPHIPPEMTTESQATPTVGHGTTINTPHYFMYYPYPHYQPDGQPLFQEIPDYFQFHYFPINQNFHGKPPYPQTPDLHTQTAELLPPTASKPLDATPTTSPMTKPATKPTTEPTTICPKRKYKLCARKTTSTSSGQHKPYVPLNQLPFTPYVSYKAADIVRDDQIDLPKEDGKYGIRSLENSDADADIPLLSNSTDKDNDQYD
ncbi:uncharacterized protein LOC125011120 isoform X1 [Mugil cephalus]|uniref:uncharacterized protein LOC125011120 isoform X1 n=1 Tax=Mugil cephalus TaxID=48193 RepID=UPI001FB68875|nr:uncharacterized protein LOC125011120 isoform X1 [Mugil cephalus]